MDAELFKDMAQCIIDGDDEQAESLAHLAIAQGIDPLEAVNLGFVAGIDQVGERFSCGDAFLPELVMAGEAMKAAIAVLEPEMDKQGTVRQVLGKVILGTVAGDIHDIGKTLVGTLLSANGFEVIDLGVDVPVEKFADQARALGADIVGVSALLTTTMARQRDVVEALDDLGLRPKVKIIVGGAPVTQSWVDEIHADGFSEDAVGAVSVARQLMANKPIQA